MTGEFLIPAIVLVVIILSFARTTYGLVFAEVFDVYQYIDIVEKIEGLEPLIITGKMVWIEMMKEKRGLIWPKHTKAALTRLEQEGLLVIWSHRPDNPFTAWEVKLSEWGRLSQKTDRAMFKLMTHKKHLSA